MQDQETSYDEDTELSEGKRINLLDAIKASNLVPLLNKADVGRIGSEALQEYQIDWESCKDWRELYDRAMNMAMQVKKEKSYPWPKASNVIFPLLTQSAIQFQARAYPAIIDGPQIVKGRVLGKDPDGTKQDRADRIADHLSWQFLNDVPGWEEDTDKLLLALPIVGCLFRKTWHDPIRSQNNSETVSAKDFVVNYKTTSLDKAPRFTHVQRFYPHEIEEFIRSGMWERVHYQEDSDPHALVEIYEQHRLIDMDEDGLPEPYVVTFTEGGEVARIVACFDHDGIYISSPESPKAVSMADMMENPDHPMPTHAKVQRIERKNYFTKYGFIPSPDGSVYDMGFGTLTDNLGAAVNSILNQLIDAGTLANMQGGFLAGGAKIRSGNMRFTPGEWKRVEGATSGPLRDNILPLQLPGPSATLFQLLGMLIESVKGITSVSDILTGNQESQTAPTTALALIEQGQKVFTAIYQRIHRSFGCEIKIMRALNRDYLGEEQDFPSGDEQKQVGKQDYRDREMDVLPTSDPRAINDRVKMAKAQILEAYRGDPLVNQLEIRKRTFEAAGIEDIKALLEVQPPPPDPAIAAKAGEMALKHDENKYRQRLSDAQAASALVTAATGAFALGVQMGDAEISLQTQRMLTDAIALADTVSAALNGAQNGQPTDGQGPVPAMGGPPADGGVPGVPEGVGGPDGQPMGGGVPDDGAAAGGGGNGDVPVEAPM